MTAGGGSGARAGIRRLFLLLIIFAIPLFFVLLFAVEALFLAHGRPWPRGPETTQVVIRARHDGNDYDAH
jgi:hypothetical protein